MDDVSMQADGGSEGYYADDSVTQEPQFQEQPEQQQQVQEEPKKTYKDLIGQYDNMRIGGFRSPQYNNAPSFYEQPQQAPTYGNNEDLIRSEINSMRTEMVFLQAEKDHPELDPSSPNYDLEFDNIVYELWQAANARGENVSASRIANQVKAREQRIIEKIKQETAQQTIKNTQEKIAGGALPSVKGDVGSGDVELKALYNRFKETGDPEDLANYNIAKKRRSL